MTYSFSVSGSRKPTAESPGYHPFTAEEAKAFDKAVDDLGNALKAAGLSASIGGTRPGTTEEYAARPPLVGTPAAHDTSSVSFSKSY